jgi:hypothetical protein
MWQHRDVPQTFGWDRQRRAQKVTLSENVHLYQLTLRKNIDLHTETLKKRHVTSTQHKNIDPHESNTGKQLLSTSENSTKILMHMTEAE